MVYGTGLLGEVTHAPFIFLISLARHDFEAQCCDVACSKLETWGEKEKEKGGKCLVKGKEKRPQFSRESSSNENMIHLQSFWNMFERHLHTMTPTNLTIKTI